MGNKKKEKPPLWSKFLGALVGLWLGFFLHPAAEITRIWVLNYHLFRLMKRWPEKILYAIPLLISALAHSLLSLIFQPIIGLYVGLLNGFSIGLSRNLPKSLFCWQAINAQQKAHVQRWDDALNAIPVTDTHIISRLAGALNGALLGLITSPFMAIEIPLDGIAVALQHNFPLARYPIIPLIVIAKIIGSLIASPLLYTVKGFIFGMERGFIDSFTLPDLIAIQSAESIRLAYANAKSPNSDSRQVPAILKQEKQRFYIRHPQPVTAIPAESVGNGKSYVYDTKPDSAFTASSSSVTLTSKS